MCIRDSLISYFLFLRSFLFTCNCFTLSFTSTAVGTGTLTTKWQSFTMSQATVAGDIQETFNIHLDFTTQCPFSFKLPADNISNCSLFFVIPLIHLLIVGYASLI